MPVTSVPAGKNQKMKVILLTNMPAYQQIDLAEALIAVLGSDNVRLAVYGSLSKSREKMGWKDQYNQPYLLRFKDSEQDRLQTLQWIADADVVIQGRFPIKHVRKRIKQGGLTYAYQERVWKKGFTFLRLLSRIPFLIKNYYSVNRHNYHLLAAGRYASNDLTRLGLFKNRVWKFGYFITAKTMPVKPAITPLKIIWCGRLMSLKRPQRALQLAKILHKAGASFTLDIVGDGEMRPELELQASSLGLSEMVNFIGWQTVAEVNDRMANAHVFMMTSDHREGWGVVINEAINNGCFPIVCDEVGSARWLIQHQRTGLIYRDEDFEQVCNELATLYVANPNAILLQGLQGHQRQTAEWSAQAAADRLVIHAKALLAADDAQKLFEAGPCSTAH